MVRSPSGMFTVGNVFLKIQICCLRTLRIVLALTVSNANIVSFGMSLKDE
jgi:hypothetical protein